MAQSPRRSRRLWGLDPLPLQSEDDTQLAQRLESINPLETDKESTNRLIEKVPINLVLK